MPITVTDDNDLEWTAIGYDAETGEHLWVQAGTDVLRAPMIDLPTEPEQLELALEDDRA